MSKFERARQGKMNLAGCKGVKIEGAGCPVRGALHHLLAAQQRPVPHSEVCGCPNVPDPGQSQDSHHRPALLAVAAAETHAPAVDGPCATHDWGRHKPGASCSHALAETTSSLNSHQRHTYFSTGRNMRHQPCHIRQHVLALPGESVVTFGSEVLALVAEAAL